MTNFRTIKTLLLLTALFAVCPGSDVVAGDGEACDPESAGSVAKFWNASGYAGAGAPGTLHHFEENLLLPVMNGVMSWA